MMLNQVTLMLFGNADFFCDGSFDAAGYLKCIPVVGTLLRESVSSSRSRKTRNLWRGGSRWKKKKEGIFFMTVRNED